MKEKFDSKKLVREISKSLEEKYNNLLKDSLAKLVEKTQKLLEEKNRNFEKLFQNNMLKLGGIK